MTNYDIIWEVSSNGVVHQSIERHPTLISVLAKVQ